MPPVVERELRSAARHWGTHWLRVLSGAAMLAALAALVFARSRDWISGMGWTPAATGSLFFGGFHIVLLGMFACLCPMMTGDCLSRERREGTLGLLFLTPLTAWDVVVGKGLVHVLRAFGLWLSAIPFLAVPFLMGGVQPADFARAVAIELSVVLIGLAAGFLATARTTRWASAMLCAMGYAVLLWFLMLVVCAIVAVPALNAASAAARGAGPTRIDAQEWVGTPIAIVFFSAAAGAWPSVGGLGTLPPWILPAVDRSLVAVVAFAVLVFALSVGVSGSILARSRKALDSASAAGSGKSRRWGRDRGRPPIDGNPIRWLQAQSPLLRWGRWGWLAVVVLVWVCVGILAGIESILEYIGWAFPPVMMLAMALAAAGSFRRELEEGTMEILLVTTMPPRFLVMGRARALWATFGPALAASLGIQLAFLQPSDLGAWWIEAQLVAAVWLTLPMVGMRCAMRRLNPMVGWIVVLAWGVVAPMGLAALLNVWLGAMYDRDSLQMWVVLSVVAQGVASVWWGRMTVWDLETRHFMERPFHRKPA